MNIHNLNSGDLNDCVENGAFFINDAQNIANIPSDFGSYRGFLIIYHMNSYVGQVIYKQDGALYWRWGLHDKSAFLNWKKVVLTEI